VIDPANQMPVISNQISSTNQQNQLSTERVPSTIPKAGTYEGTWLYPSSQMFWNAMVRKNKAGGDSNEKDMDTVVKVHNNMNENTWLQVLAWEALYPPSSDPDRQPKLLKFLGRPDELSPKAYIKTLFGHPKPFDRHDWIVDRGGHQIRYVIDYYSDESMVTQDNLPQHIKDIHSMKSIRVDVRPALDSLAACFDRFVRMPWMRLQGHQKYNPPPFFAPSRMIIAEQQKQQRLVEHWTNIQTNCSKAKETLKNCKSDYECSVASVELQKCIAGIVCPSVLKDFQASLAATPQKLERVESTYAAMTKCIDTFEIDSRK
jgi:cytochrome c heme-lyase